MTAKPILIVDDEKNIRLALSMALEQLDIPVETAASGEEALERLAQGGYELMLLDLRMPGLDGMEVLRQVSQQRPEIKVIIITAYGSIDLAVEAMKLGAVDFLQKPFDVGQVREVVHRILEKSGESYGYEDYLVMAKQRVIEGHFELAGVYAQKAVFLNPDRPEALNLLGGIAEVKGNRLEADGYYRAALTHDPAYAPAQRNLERIATQTCTPKGIVWDYSDQGKKQLRP
jgi:CheY-like chemotaxis protein